MAPRKRRGRSKRSAAAQKGWATRRLKALLAERANRARARALRRYWKAVRQAAQAQGVPVATVRRRAAAPPAPAPTPPPAPPPPERERGFKPRPPREPRILPAHVFLDEEPPEGVPLFSAADTAAGHALDAAVEVARKPVVLVARGFLLNTIEGYIIGTAEVRVTIEEDEPPWPLIIADMKVALAPLRRNIPKAESPVYGLHYLAIAAVA